MTIPEAAQLVIQAGSMGQGGEVYVLDMGKPVKIFDLARRMVHLSGLELRDEEHPDGDIAIEVVGLRPGEKLYEELLIGENVEGTSHPLIMRAYEHEVPWAVLTERLASLDEACQAFDYEGVLALLGVAGAGIRPGPAWRRRTAVAHHGHVDQGRCAGALKFWESWTNERKRNGAGRRDQPVRSVGKAAGWLALCRGRHPDWVGRGRRSDCPDSAEVRGGGGDPGWAGWAGWAAWTAWASWPDFQRSG